VLVDNKNNLIGLAANRKQKMSALIPFGHFRVLKICLKIVHGYD
jgi:hypothetical protein